MNKWVNNAANVQREYENWQADESKLHLVYKWANGDELSTILLPPVFYPKSRWESCIFYADGTSKVLEQWFTEDEARAGHERLIVEYSR